MIENPPLLTIHRGWRRPDHALVARFRGAQTANLVDAMEGRGAVDWRIKPLDPTSAAFVGPALTAYAYPADIVAMFGAIAEAERGDVIMLACDGFTGTAVIGDQAAGMMRNKDVTAFVTDGLARDRAGIVATGLPVFCAGITPNSPATNGPGTVGGPIMLGGVHVCSGDVVVGDADSVVVVPADRLVEVLTALDHVRAAEAESERQVKAGLTLPENVRAMVAAARIVQR
jgi:4-hydroxy-4-methyl-2-oxoglutarate aldolase